MRHRPCLRVLTLSLSWSLSGNLDLFQLTGGMVSSHCCTRAKVPEMLQKLSHITNNTVTQHVPCDSPITLLSVLDKVFEQVLLGRLSPLLNRTCHPQQSGFTQGRFTLDAILSLRLSSQLHREFNKPLHVAYVDITRYQISFRLR